MVILLNKCSSFHRITVGHESWHGLHFSVLWHEQFIRFIIFCFFFCLNFQLNEDVKCANFFFVRKFTLSFRHYFWSVNFRFVRGDLFDLKKETRKHLYKFKCKWKWINWNKSNKILPLSNCIICVWYILKMKMIDFMIEKSNHDLDEMVKRIYENMFDGVLCSLEGVPFLWWLFRQSSGGK